jgi:PKD repeat protein
MLSPRWAATNAVTEDLEMAEMTSQLVKKSNITGWIKTVGTSLAGALSGAVLMYASTVVDMVIKPAKPIANFQCQADGLKVTMQNKSTGGHEGWWDFGDGSALEAFVPTDAAITHAYAKPASYAVKLSLKNLVGEENERTVNVVVEQGGSSLPSIDTFDIVATHGDYAPAVFHVVSTVKNADLCIWAVGNRALEFSPETANGNHERLITIKEPGNYVVKLAAYNSSAKQQIEKTTAVVVKKAPAGLVTATLDVTYEAIFVEQKTTNPVAVVRFPAEQKGDLATVTQPIAAELGFEIVKADLAQSTHNPSIKSTKVEIDPVKRDKVLLTCELARPAATKRPPSYTVQVALTQERQSPPATKTTEPVSVNLTVPGTTKVPLPALPAGWLAKSRKMTLTLQQESKKFVWKDGELPQSTAVEMSSSNTYVVSAVEESGQLRIDVGEIKKAWSLFGQR